MVYIKVTGDPALQLLFVKEARAIKEMKYIALDQIVLKSEGTFDAAKTALNWFVGEGLIVEDEQQKKRKKVVQIEEISDDAWNEALSLPGYSAVYTDAK